MGMRRISLTLVLHNHQPVGNFGFVFEDNHRLAYAPMIEALERHPGVRLGLHYTGPLLDWFSSERPEVIERLRGLVDREQVEILGGGYHEPVLASLPEADRVGQLTRMADEVESLFGRRPDGAWLAERVWEPDVPTSLVTAGYRYTILDDAHFRAAAIPDERHWGTYSTDDQGYRLLAFGTEQGLRYRIPFRPVEEVIDYLRGHATEDGERVGMMGDDGEKFGTWPGTHERCWGEGAWVERFFSAVEENADWLTSLRPSDALRRHPPIGRVYVPTGSYAEMGEWSLPVEARREYTSLLHAATEAGRPEARWMRGGFWRNFQTNYREINDLHKQMLRVSRKVERVREAGTDTSAMERMTDHLYRGQSNDCYWHGLFGGIYLSHLRLATLYHLIAAEDAADRAVAVDSIGVIVERADFDIDGYDEVLVSAAGQRVLIKPDAGGAIGSWDIRAVRHALTSVLRRRPEAYHDVLRAADSGEITQREAGKDAVSIHDLVQVNEPGISRRLWYDAYERRSGLVHVLPEGTTAEAFERADFAELGDLVADPYDVVEIADGAVVVERAGHVLVGKRARAPVLVRKRLEVGGDRREPTLELVVEVTNRGTRRIDALLGVEWALNLLGGGGNPSAWFEAAGERGSFDGRRSADQVQRVVMANDWVGIGLESRAEPVADAWWSSIETISASESGFEAIHQGGCLLWLWPLKLAGGRSMTVRVSHHVRAFADRAEEESL